MSCKPAHIAAVNGASDPQTLVLGSKVNNFVSLHDFSITTRVVLALFQNGTQTDSLDSDVTGETDAIDYSGGDGELELDIGPQNITAGDYNVRVTVYDSDYPSGLVFNRGDGYTFDLTITD